MGDVAVIDPTSDRRWEALTQRSASDVFQSAAWIRCVTAPYAFEPLAAVLIEGDDVVAGMPFVDAEGVAGRRLVVGPFSDYCDPIVRGEDDWNSLRDHLVGCDLPVRLRLLRFRPTEEESHTPADKAHWHGLALDRPLDQIWDSMDPSARRAIGKAGRNGVQIVEGQDLADLESFYDLHVDVRRKKYGLLAQPFAFFEKIWQEFVMLGAGRLSLAVQGDQVVAGVLFIEWRDRAYYKFNASLSEALDLRPNDAIVWDAIQHYVSRGKSLLDFGLSDWEQEGLARYKAKFGATAGVITTHAFGPPNAPPAIAEVLGPLTSLLTDSSVPRHVVVRAGELLYSSFV